MKNTEGMRVATVWKLCLEMWDDEELLSHCQVWIGKSRWCRKKGYKIDDNCFFCDFARRTFFRKHKRPYREFEEACKYCPGRAVSPSFNCFNRAYRYNVFPRKFAVKLHRMNKKRLEMNRAKR
ncbi:hypothetical protein KAR91_46080 [Candidatus Pacearchaeota archaeon]|nr:hypothetical protein [Candidatus Pacearchaeota archaeon]